LDRVKIDKKALLYDSPHLAPVVVDTRANVIKLFTVVIYSYQSAVNITMAITVEWQ
jgi:hypothetical protein